MSDIVERLRHCSENCGDEYLHELAGRAAARIDALEKVIRYALENGVGTQYHDEDDECGTHSCCGKVSYKPHDPECWTVKASAALEDK